MLQRYIFRPLSFLFDAFKIYKIKTNFNFKKNEGRNTNDKENFKESIFFDN
jgi:hypothetical protein